MGINSKVTFSMFEQFWKQQYVSRSTGIGQAEGLEAQPMITLLKLKVLIFNP